VFCVRTCLPIKQRKDGLEFCCAGGFTHPPLQENESIAARHKNRKSKPEKVADSYAAGVSFSRPPIYGRSTAGIVTLPSACW
jgi:hypothetical protein